MALAALAAIELGETNGAILDLVPTSRHWGLSPMCFAACLKQAQENNHRLGRVVTPGRPIAQAAAGDP